MAFTAEADYNQTLIDSHDSGQLTFGLEVGNYIHAKDYTKITIAGADGCAANPLPTRYPARGRSQPVADAGPNQLGIAPGTVTLNGSGSYDPAGEALTYQWTQIAGPNVSLSNPTGVTTTFTAAAGQTYSFRLTVKNTDNVQATSSTTVSTTSPGQTLITQFYANPASISAGQSSTLVWVTSGATSVSIAPGIGVVNAVRLDFSFAHGDHYLYNNGNRPERLGKPVGDGDGGRCNCRALRRSYGLKATR